VRFKWPLIAALICGLCVDCGSPAAVNGASPASPSPIADSSQVQQQCQTYTATGFTLQAAYTSNAGTVAAWIENYVEAGHRVTSEWRGYPASMGVTVCYILGPWAVPEPPLPPGVPPPSTPRPAFDLGIVFVGANGLVRQGPIGNHVTMQLERPHA
jgi:hypothetical protein